MRWTVLYWPCTSVPKSGSHTFLGMQLVVAHPLCASPRRTPHGAARSVQCLSGRQNLDVRAPCRLCRGATDTTVMCYGLQEHPPPPTSPSNANQNITPLRHPTQYKPSFRPARRSPNSSHKLTVVLTHHYYWRIEGVHITFVSAGCRGTNSSKYTVLDNENRQPSDTLSIDDCKGRPKTGTITQSLRSPG